MHTISSRTIEFLFPEIIPDHWFDLLTRVWNDGLFILNWYEHQQRIQKCQKQGIAINPEIQIEVKKDGEKWVYYQPTEIKRRIDKTKSKLDKDNLEIVPIDFSIPREEILRPDDKRVKPRYVNPLWLSPAPIAKDNAIELRKPFAKKRCEWLMDSDIPSVYVNDFIGLVLIAAWEAWKKGIRKHPNYKRDKNKISTIPSASFRHAAKFLGNNRISLPGFEVVTIRNLDSLVSHPLIAMSKDMAKNPLRYPELQAKIEKQLIVDRAILVRENYNKAPSQLKKEMSPEEFDKLISEYNNYLDLEDITRKAIEYYKEPGSFRLVKKNGKNYLQISGFFATNSTKTDKSISIETGKKLLVDGSNKLKVKHYDFSDLEQRLKNIDRRMSLCQHGSRTYNKLLHKKRQLESRIKSNRKCHQTFYAAQIADVNQQISIRQLKLADTIGRPLPKPDGEGGYLPNGATKRHEENRKIYDCALGQFVLTLKNQSSKRGRDFVEVEDTATSLSSDSVRARSSRKISPSSSPSESETVERKLKEGGKRKRDSQQSASQPPVPIKFKKRQPYQERQIPDANP